MKIEGSCHCGRVRFEANADPERVSICHCADCQSLTGSAFRVTVPVAEAELRMLGEEPKTYVKTTADSGNPRAQAFCPECGSPIYATSVGEGPKVYGIRVGTLRQRADLPPNRQIWHSSALPWLRDAFADLATVEKA
ncbi:MAG TPA: GFA family protein [Mesorhizobium sp.]|nr:GFA family protein [Mesorhizobium sp.]